MKCSYCKKTGHLIKTCYKIHGYPPGYKYTNTRDSSTSSGGHSSTTNQVESMLNDAVVSDTHKVDEVIFTRAEVQKMLSMIGAPMINDAQGQCQGC